MLQNCEQQRTLPKEEVLAQNANLRSEVSFFLETTKGKDKIFTTLLTFLYFIILGYNAVPNAVESTGKCKLGYSLEKLFFWCFKPQLLSVSTVDFLLSTRHLFICEIIEIDLPGNILSDEFITRISDEAKKTHDTKTYRA